MPNIDNAIQDEILRIARKEAKSAATPRHKPAGATRLEYE